MMGEGAYQSDFNSPELVNPGAEQVWAVLHGIDDPCMCLAGKGLSIVDMGIVTKVEVRDDRATIELVFTDPSCLFELRIVGAIEERLARLDGLADFQVQIACQTGSVPRRRLRSLRTVKNCGPAVPRRRRPRSSRA
jgi:metal-sulfur cluster biosynthetic enzyme